MMTLHQLTDEAREMYANAVGIPWQAWAIVVLIAAFGFLLARACEGFDPYADRPGYEPERPEGDLFVDAHGERYTTHSFATAGDPWYGATILTPSVVARLDVDGLLPLREVSWPTCDAQDGPRRCGRMYGHDGHHVDPFTGTRYHSARWSL